MFIKHNGVTKWLPKPAHDLHLKVVAEAEKKAAAAAQAARKKTTNRAVITKLDAND